MTERNNTLEALENAILAAVSSAEYEHCGLRVLEEEDLAQPGATLRPSRVWEDGEPTEELLDGVSTIWVEDDEASVARALRSARAYYGHQIVVVGGNWGHAGRDFDEYIIEDPIVLASFRYVNE